MCFYIHEYLNFSMHSFVSVGLRVYAHVGVNMYMRIFQYLLIFQLARCICCNGVRGNFLKGRAKF